MINKSFQEQLRYYRKARGLRQDDLGEILGVSGQTIYKYEHGVNFPSPDTLEKILDYFNIDPNTLFNYQSTTNDEMEEIRNLLENHKRVHREVAFLAGIGKENILVDLLQDKYSDLKHQYSQKDILDIQRFLLMKKIENIVIKMEEESTEKGNPHTETE